MSEQHKAKVDTAPDLVQIWHIPMFYPLGLQEFEVPRNYRK